MCIRDSPSRDSVRDYYYESTSEQEGLEDAIKKSMEIGVPYYVTKKYSEVSTVFNSGMDTVWAGEVLSLIHILFLKQML